MTTAQVPVASASQAATRKQKAPRDRGTGGLLPRVVLIIICLLWLIPLVGTFITSFRSQQDANSTGWWTVFTHPSLSLSNYHDVIVQANLGQAFINSFAITLPATFIPILFAAFAAYAFTFMEFKGREVLFVIVVSLLVVPNFVSFVPILKIYANIHLAGQFPAAWLAHIGFGMSLAIYILRNYMATLPRTIIESAQIDGASHFQTFYRLILPMSVPALASFAIFQFLWVWNDLLVALVFIQPGDNAPITVATSQLLGQQGQNWNLVTAGGMVSMVVPILVFLSLQQFFVRGLTAGAVKG
ncbi:MAG TPA: carbohydrate ABC transporter permease [Nocardioidaceae bacterium]|jgi:alpha-glucoside transport system permease protein|nr:carbohydrate ABC transporter permease [Nocardioidaceae bacterium]